MFLPIEASLRQFARAVTADQLAGDELVRAVTEEMRADGEIKDRAEAFRRFVAKWRELTREDAAPKLFTDAALVQSIGPPPAQERMVLLLSDVAGFSAHEVEAILGPLDSPHADLLAAARSAVSKSRKARAVIVEDEPLVAMDLRGILEGMGLEVVGMARTAASGARIAADRRPDILLADYNLEGNSTGVEAVLGMQESHRCPVVFITGYPDKVLSGEDVEPDFVIVKPYKAEAIRAVVAHCLETGRLTVTE